MDIEKTHVYFVPGLAANKEIFRNIQLPIDTYQIHILEWLLPKKKESMDGYAQRMAQCIAHENPVLVGVSFGGVIAQEMSKFIKLAHLIIISSIKTRNELPKRLRWVRRTKAYKIVPTGLVLSVSDLTELSLGSKSKKRLAIYQQYLSVRDRGYLDWAIEQMVCWNRSTPDPKVKHIHGDADIVFPVKNIKDAVLIKGGTHIMILNKAHKISELLLKMIEK